MPDTDPGDVRADAGGWISGPCLPDPGTPLVINLGDLPPGTVVDLGTGMTRRIDLGQPLPIRLADQSPAQITDLAARLAAALEDDADFADLNMPAGSLAECSECGCPLVLGTDRKWRREGYTGRLADVCSVDDYIRAHIPQPRPDTGWQVEAYRGYLLATRPGTTTTFILAPRPDALLVARDRIEWAREFVDCWTDPPADEPDELDDAGQAHAGRPCCDHCNNLEGDPNGHDYGDESAHDGPCAQCAAEDDDEPGPVVNEVHADRILISTDAVTGRVVLHCQDDGSTSAYRPTGGVPFTGRGGGDGTTLTLADLNTWAARHADEHLTVANYTRPGLPLPPPTRLDEGAGLWVRGTDPDDLAYTSLTTLHATDHSHTGVVTIGAHCIPCGHPYQQTGSEPAAKAAIRRDHATHRAVTHQDGS